MHDLIHSLLEPLTLTYIYLFVLFHFGHHLHLYIDLCLSVIILYIRASDSEVVIVSAVCRQTKEQTKYCYKELMT